MVKSSVALTVAADLYSLTSACNPRGNQDLGVSLAGVSGAAQKLSFLGHGFNSSANSFPLLGV